MKTGLIKNIEIDIYGEVLTLLIHNTLEEAVKISSKLHKYNKEHSFKGYSGLTFVDVSEDICHIVLKCDATLNIVSHECFHATCGILRQRGIELTEYSEEAFAYLHGFIVEKVWNELEKCRNGKGTI